MIFPSRLLSATINNQSFAAKAWIRAGTVLGEQRLVHGAGNDDAESFFAPLCSLIIEIEGSFTSNQAPVIGPTFAAQSDVVLLC